MTDPTLRTWHDPAAAEVGDTVAAFLDRLDGPVAIRLSGHEPGRCRAVVTLLHGNEPSGVRALHAHLRAGVRPRTDTWCIVAAVAAARLPPGFAHRMLPGGRDLNRCFTVPDPSSEGRLAAAILAQLQSARPEAIVDLHNNSGRNPPYGVGTGVDPLRLRLTALFAERYVYSDIALGSLMEAAGAIAPTVTIECGRAGDPAADAIAHAGLARFLAAEQLEHIVLPPLHLFAHPVRVCVVPGTRLAFADGPVGGADLTLARDVDRHNFEELPAGTPIGWLGTPSRWPLEARTSNGGDLSHALFALRDTALCTRQPLTPIMMTTDPVAAATDCLFYAVSPPPRG